jgi:hypothetical protein
MRSSFGAQLPNFGRLPKPMFGKFITLLFAYKIPKCNNSASLRGSDYSGKTAISQLSAMFPCFHKGKAAGVSTLFSWKV